VDDFSIVVVPASDQNEREEGPDVESSSTRVGDRTLYYLRRLIIPVATVDASVPL